MQAPAARGHWLDSGFPPGEGKRPDPTYLPYGNIGRTPAFSSLMIIITHNIFGNSLKFILKKGAI